MKKLVGAVIGIFLILISLMAVAELPTDYTEETIPIDEDHFPDPVFRAFVEEKYDGNRNNMLDPYERVWWNMYCQEMDISSLEGIEYFYNLRSLYCNNNKLDFLDVSKNTFLIELYCHNNQLKNLELYNNHNFEVLYCENNQLTNLDVSIYTTLKSLCCGGNKLTSLDVSNNPMLEQLSCGGNQLTSLDLMNNSSLNRLSCGGNQLYELDISENHLLTDVRCQQNLLTNLNANENSLITDLNCSGNQIVNLDILGCTSLKYLWCYDNKMKTLNVSGLDIYEITCYNNQLETINVNGCNKLRSLTCYNNQIEQLDFSKASILNTTVKSTKPTNNSKYLFWRRDINAGKTSWIRTDNNVKYISNKGIVSIFPVDNIELNHTEWNFVRTVNIEKQDLQLSVTITPNNASNPALKWSTSNKKVATVDQNGLVMALKAGTAVITCSSTDGSNVTATCEITVIDQKVERIDLDQSKLNLVRTSKNEKPTGKLSATITPSDALSQTVKWTSSDKKIVMVDQNGTIKGLKPGTAIITCSPKSDTSIKSTCKVTVEDKAVKKITMEKKKVTVKQWNTVQLKVKKIEPTDALNTVIQQFRDSTASGLNLGR